MSNLTAEAILNELSKLRDSTGRAMSFAEGQTIVPNTLLTQVWEEAERQERERIIEMLEAKYGCDSEFDCDEPCTSDHWIDTKIQYVIAQIKGEQK